MGEEKDAPVGQLTTVLIDVACQALTQGISQVPKVIDIIEAGPVPAVIACKWRDAHQLRDAVDIQRHHENRVGKVMSLRTKATMPQGSRIDR